MSFGDENSVNQSIMNINVRQISPTTALNKKNIDVIVSKNSHSEE